MEHICPSYDMIKSDTRFSNLQKAVSLSRDILLDCRDIPGLSYYAGDTTARVPIEDIEIVIAYESDTIDLEEYINGAHPLKHINIWIASKGKYVTADEIVIWFCTRMLAVCGEHKFNVKAWGKSVSFEYQLANSTSRDALSLDSVILRYTNRITDDVTRSVFSIETVRGWLPFKE